MARKKDLKHEESIKTQKLLVDLGLVEQERHEEFMKRKLLEGANYSSEIPHSAIITRVMCLGIEDAHELHKAEQSYGDSWKQRGGIGAFMMAARKWDRLQKQVEEHNYDIFKAMEADQRPEGILDDIRDLRRYLFLIDAEMCNRASQDD